MKEADCKENLQNKDEREDDCSVIDTICFQPLVIIIRLEAISKFTFGNALCGRTSSISPGHLEEMGG